MLLRERERERLLKAFRHFLYIRTSGQTLLAYVLCMVMSGRLVKASDILYTHTFGQPVSPYGGEILLVRERERELEDTSCMYIHVPQDKRY